MGEAAPGPWRTVDVGGRPARYLELGEGTPLLFLHGWGLGYRCYQAGLTRLSSLGLRVLAPALPGFGGTSGLPDVERSLTGYAGWVAEFLQAVGVEEPVTVTGHSFGGGVAIQLAHDHPDVADRLVLVNSIGGSAWRRGAAVRSLAERPLWDWGLHSATDLLPQREVTRVLPVVLNGLVRNVLDNPRAVWHAAGIAAHADLTHELAELRERELPVVILWGTSDQLIPIEAFDSLRSTLDHAQVITVSGSHNWLLSDPKAFFEVMTNVVGPALTPARRSWRRSKAAG
jgi:pimeloyl-ACP methyl ester carboxylesterase